MGRKDREDRMSLAVSFENGHSNGVDFFTPLEGESDEKVLAAVVKMWESFKSVPAGLGGAVLRSTDGSSIAVYQMWIKDTNFGEFHEELSSELENVEAIADINSNFFQPVVAEGKEDCVKHAFEKDSSSVYGIQVFGIESEMWDSVFTECHGAMKKVLESVDGPEWFIILRSWDTTKLMLLTKWRTFAEASYKVLVSVLESGLADPRFGAEKEIDKPYKVVEI